VSRAVLLQRRVQLAGDTELTTSVKGVSATLNGRGVAMTGPAAITGKAA
jgi:hypothetical protein